MDQLVNDVFHIDYFEGSLQSLTTIESYKDETCNMDINVDTSSVHTHIITIETTSTLVPMSTNVTLPQVSTIESNTKENMNLDIIENTLNANSNVNTSVIPSIDPLILLPPSISPIITYLIQTTNVRYNLPTFNGILRQPIATLFSSQSTNPSHDHKIDVSHHIDDKDDGLNLVFLLLILMKKM